MYKIPACKIPFLCYWHPDRNKATEHFQSVFIDNLVIGNKVSENAGGSGCLCSELLFQLNWCHILGLFSGLLLLPCVFISHSHLPFGSCMTPCCRGPLLLSALSFTFVEAFKPWVPNAYLSILLHLCVPFRTLSLPLSSCFLYTQDSLLVMETVRCRMPITSLCKNWFYSTNQACSKTNPVAV